MKSFKQYLDERCWKGYKPVPGKKPYSDDSCKKEEVEHIDELSKTTLGNYYNAAKQDNIDHADSRRSGDKDEAKWAKDRMVKRTTGMGAVKNRLNKEEVELDETAAWQRKEGKNPEGGLNKKGVESYRRENPGSKLQTAVTTKPSKLKPGSKAANRRKSFCARMSGMKKRLTSAKTANDPDSRINKSLRKWNC